EVLVPAGRVVRRLGRVRHGERVGAHRVPPLISAVDRQRGLRPMTLTTSLPCRSPRWSPSRLVIVLAFHAPGRPLGLIAGPGVPGSPKSIASENWCSSSGGTAR